MNMPDLCTLSMDCDQTPSHLLGSKEESDVHYRGLKELPAMLRDHADTQ